MRLFRAPGISGSISNPSVHLQQHWSMKAQLADPNANKLAGWRWGQCSSYGNLFLAGSYISPADCCYMSAIAEEG